MIDTSKGPKSPAEALALFKQTILSQGDLLGIIKQLKEKHPIEFAEAAKYVQTYPCSFSPKIKTMTQEQVTGLSVGAKTIRTGEDVRKVLGDLDLGSSVHITFAKDAASRLGPVLGMARIIQINPTDRTMLTACVVPSGRWEGIPRTYQALVYVRKGTADLKTCECYLPGVVESIQLICTRKQFADANDPCPKLLQDNPDLFFDVDLFTQACIKINRGSEARIWIKQIGTDRSMENVLKIFPYLIVRAEFFEAYVELFNAALA